ncbi:4-hydroxythreonine-4-phosphate dehydrogenase PdxA [Erythrobacter litoralis]|uniref:4-hydroxythreonine-4-phosphate dehydrogenase PdxA n=1 Tax=Erythrobacter litoralis TaxID=39960 RepID=UPI002435F26E|nr:4-hydroxythreonine-4-phosphate dehydrogenase PdxA [Erythrobacter litoralis]MDG6078658.1 4-hydroxythreonine-4-phosphate dehydrogenase PdxA [Erythrobacter litoralis]
MSASAPLAVSLGDPAGIGPEIIAAAWAARKDLDLPPFLVVGGENLLREAAMMRGLDIAIRVVETPDAALETFAGALPVFGASDCEYRPGEPQPNAIAVALGSLETATGLARAGAAAGIVTAPVAKVQLASIGFHYPGQTEYLAAACGLPEEDAVMMLAGPSLRAVPLTVHCALIEVPDRLTTDLICRKARIVCNALRRDFGIDTPRLAIAGLNPHAGEGGRFGDEEARIILPAIERLQADGLDVTGPHPGDALFTPRARENYDAALAMYHDQALIPLKALDFDEGVNVTLGLPIIRTSPDHGTAFDIAGKGLADPGAMIAAIRMAGEMAARRAGS